MSSKISPYNCIAIFHLMFLCVAVTCELRLTCIQTATLIHDAYMLFSFPDLWLPRQRPQGQVDLQASEEVSPATEEGCGQDE